MVDSISSIGHVNYTSSPGMSNSETMSTEQLQNLLKTLLDVLGKSKDTDYNNTHSEFNASLSEFMNSYFPGGGDNIASHLTSDLTGQQVHSLSHDLSNTNMPDSNEVISALNSNDISSQREAIQNMSNATDDASSSFSHLPPNSIVRQFTDPLFGANKKAEDKVKSKMDLLDQANKLTASNDLEAIKAFLRENGYNNSGLDNMSLEEAKEALNGFTETMQIRLQQDMAILQVTFQTISAIVENLKQASGKAAGAIGS